MTHHHAGSGQLLVCAFSLKTFKNGVCVCTRIYISVVVHDCMRERAGTFIRSVWHINRFSFNYNVFMILRRQNQNSINRPALLMNEILKSAVIQFLANEVIYY